MQVPSERGEEREMPTDAAGREIGRAGQAELDRMNRENAEAARKAAESKR